jgi:formate/nitrite transporter FocA (FNT family)
MAQAQARESARQELGDSEGPEEDQLKEAFDLIVSEGAQRLHRGWREVLTTGLAGGLEVGVGVVLLFAVYAETGSHLLAGLAFGVGFVALLLARSELFTEGFLVPVTAVVAGRASLGQLAKLWSGTLVGNLVGGWALMWVVVHALPDLRATAITSATTFVTAPLDLQSAALAFLAGIAITLMTRMQHGTDSVPGKIAAAVGGAFLLAGLQMFHSILDSLLIFGAIQTGDAPFGYLDWLGWFAYTVTGNILGGLVLVTLLRLLRSKDRLTEERRAAEGHRS